MKYSKPSCLQQPSGWWMHVGGSGLQSNPTRVPAHKEHAASFKLYSHSSTVYSKAPHSERTQLKRMLTRSAVYNHRSGRRMARAEGNGDRWTQQGLQHLLLAARCARSAAVLHVRVHFTSLHIGPSRATAKPSARGGKR